MNFLIANHGINMECNSRYNSTGVIGYHWEKGGNNTSHLEDTVGMGM